MSAFGAVELFLVDFFFLGRSEEMRCAGGGGDLNEGTKKRE